MPQTVSPKQRSYLSVDWQNPVNWSHGLNRDLLAWWLVTPTAMGGSTWRDLAGVHHGTFSNMDPATDWVRSTRPGGYGGINLDGVDDGIDCVESDQIVLRDQQMTISAWVKMNGDYTSIQDIVGNYQASPEGLTWHLEFGRTDNEFSFLNDHLAVTSWSNVSLADDDWHQVTCVRTGTSGSWLVYWYFDGIFNRTHSNTNNDGAANNGGPNIGRLGASGQQFNGTLDDIRIWGRPLTEAEVQEYYQLSKQSYLGLLNRWRPQFTTPLATAGNAMPMAMMQYRRRRVA